MKILIKILFLLLVGIITFSCSSCNKKIYEKNLTKQEEVKEEVVEEEMIYYEEIKESQEELWIEAVEKEENIFLEEPIVALSSPPDPIIMETQSIILKEIEVQEQKKAKLTYVINDTMMVGETYNVDLTLSKKITNNQLANIIDGFKDKPLIDTMIIITDIMRARLIDPTGKNFTVTQITEEIQNTTISDLIRWQWQVVPLIEGDNSLTISVDIYLEDSPQSVNIYNGKTHVYAIHTFWEDFGNWIEKNWSYITYIVGLIGAIIAWLYKEKIINFFKRNER